MFLTKFSQTTNLFGKENNFGLKNKKWLQLIFYTFSFLKFSSSSSNETSSPVVSPEKRKTVFSFENTKKIIQEVDVASDGLLLELKNLLEVKADGENPTTTANITKYVDGAYEKITKLTEIATTASEHIQKHTEIQDANYAIEETKIPLEKIEEALNKLMDVNYRFSNACDNYITSQGNDREKFREPLAELMAEISQKESSFDTEFISFTKILINLMNIAQNPNITDDFKQKITHFLKAHKEEKNKLENETKAISDKLKKNVTETTEKCDFSSFTDEEKATITLALGPILNQTEKESFLRNLICSNRMSISKLVKSKKENIIKIEIENMEKTIFNVLKNLTEANKTILKDLIKKLELLSFEYITNLHNSLYVKKIVMLLMKFYKEIPANNSESSIPLKLLKFQLDKLKNHTTTISTTFKPKIDKIKNSAVPIKPEDISEMQNVLKSTIIEFEKIKGELMITTDFIELLYSKEHKAPVTLGGSPKPKDSTPTNAGKNDKDWLTICLVFVAVLIIIIALLLVIYFFKKK